MSARQGFAAGLILVVGVIAGLVLAQAGRVAASPRVGSPAAQVEPPPFWTPLPQPGPGRTGVYTACHAGFRLWMTEGGGTPGSTSITSQPDPTCGGKP